MFLPSAFIQIEKQFYAHQNLQTIETKKTTSQCEAVFSY